RRGQHNVGMGYYADFTSSDSYNNNRATFMGADLDVNGNDLIAIGYSAETRDDESISIGAYSDGNGRQSIGIGYLSFLTSTADRAVALGHMTYMSQNNSVAIGAYDSVTASHGTALGYDVNVSGDSSVAIGSYATISGKNSIALGANTSVSSNNSIAIGYQATTNAANEVYIGNSSISSIGGAVNWTAVSDGRYKKDVAENVPGLDFITKLRPVTYTFDTDKLANKLGQTNLNPEKESTIYSGFIAQEIESAAKESGYDFSGVKVPTDSNDLYGIRYAEMVVPLVKAVQELNEKVSQMETYVVSDEKVSKRRRSQGRIAMLQNEIELLKEQNKLLTEIANSQVLMATK
ncbi:MAG: tail fiber domain-containing protein, partial [Bacteroidia bacterium]